MDGLFFRCVSHILMLIQIIDDGDFTISRVFIGFYQWFYLLPLIIHRKNKMKSYKGFLVGGFSIFYVKY